MARNTAKIEESYTAYGRTSELFTSTEEEMMLTGPAGTGKSRGILEYLNYQAMTHANARILMVRKTRRSLTESGMVTLERKVLHPAQDVHFKSSVQQYQYPNGSIIAVGGLDKPEKILSSEWDIIYPQEATELGVDDWEMCSLRLRNGVLPAQQMVGDCNADKSTHWILDRVRAGKLTRLETQHEDNPTYFNRDGTKTPDGARYLARLDQLTGVRYARYRLGLWVSAEGMIYEDTWNPAHNLVNSFRVPREWPRFLSIDFGFVHPFVCLWGAIDPDGRIYVYRQLYKTKTLVEDHAETIKRVSRWGQPDGDPLPRAIICDHDAEDRATLTRHLGLITIPAHKTVSDGIQAVASRFKVLADGKPRLMIMRDSLIEVDREQAEAKKPTCLQDEIENYRWDTRQGMKKGEAPVKEDDDGANSLRYLVASQDLRPTDVRYSNRIF